MEERHMAEKRRMNYPYNVGFTYFDGERWIEDETQFDIDEFGFTAVATTLVRLFRKFCDENHFSPAFMTYVGEPLPW